MGRISTGARLSLQFPSLKASQSPSTRYLLSRRATADCHSLPCQTGATELAVVRYFAVQKTPLYATIILQCTAGNKDRATTDVQVKSDAPFAYGRGCPVRLSCQEHYEADAFEICSAKRRSPSLIEGEKRTLDPQKPAKSLSVFSSRKPACDR